MPVDLNTLFQNVSVLDDNVQFHAPAADDLRQGSALHGAGCGNRTVHA